MERPPANTEPKRRELTGEIMYLDEMRRLNFSPEPYEAVSGMAMQMYETEADMMRARGLRPDIMEAYERYDKQAPEVVASCVALADELLTLKEPDSPFTFVDIVVEESAESVLTRLRTMAAGKFISADDEQLAIPSDGEYYPVLDMRKQHAKLVGVGLRVWGWDDRKYIFTDKAGERQDYPRNTLFYPSDEKSSTRQLELAFVYQGESSGGFSESVSLYLSASGAASMTSNVWSAAYAETGYEGHKHSSSQQLEDADIAAFGDLIAEIVGDTPKSAMGRIIRSDK